MLCGRTSLEIQQPVTTRDATNGRVVTWTKVATTFADMRAVRGREDTSSASGDSQTAQETWLAVIPFRADLLAITSYRAVVDGINYNIRSAMDRDRRRRNITLELESGVGI